MGSEKSMPGLPPKGWLRVERCDHRFKSGRRCTLTVAHVNDHSLTPLAGNSSLVLSDYVLVRIARKR